MAVGSRDCLPVWAMLYEEARSCFSVGAFTSAALACRKILMNVAVVELEKPAGKTFAEYISWLDDAHYIAPGGKEWVADIKKLGGEATHEIRPKSEDEARLAVDFTEGLLRFIYDFPTRRRPES